MKRKRDRQWLLGGVLIGLTVWVWWGYLYAPLKDQIQETEDAYALQLKKKMQFKEKRHQLSVQLSESSSGDDGVDMFSDFMGKSRSLEEFNAVIQQEVQRFLDENEISLKKISCPSLHRLDVLPIGRFGVYHTDPPPGTCRAFEVFRRVAPSGSIGACESEL